METIGAVSTLEPWSLPGLRFLPRPWFQLKESFAGPALTPVARPRAAFQCLVFPLSDFPHYLLRPTVCRARDRAGTAAVSALVERPSVSRETPRKHAFDYTWIGLRRYSPGERWAAGSALTRGPAGWMGSGTKTGVGKGSGTDGRAECRDSGSSTHRTRSWVASGRLLSFSGLSDFHAFVGAMTPTSQGGSRVSE